MKIDHSLTDDAIITELGQRIARYRLNRNITQHEMAQLSDVSIATLKRIESGESSTNLVNMIRILRALNKLDNMDLLLPPEPVSPLISASTGKRTRKRARPKKENSTQQSLPWTWGSEKGNDKKGNNQ